MPEFNEARIRLVNECSIDPKGTYVLYWMQMYRRLTCNHALDYAMKQAVNLKKPLVIYEGLKLNYPWANARIHTFILEGMKENALQAKQLGINYWPFVETVSNSGKGLVHSLASRACLVVTDDFPQFIVPAQTEALARKVDVAVYTVDSNGIIPLSMLGQPTTAAMHLRRRIHKLFATAWRYRSHNFPQLTKTHTTQVEPTFELWNAPADLSGFVSTLPLDRKVMPVTSISGGTAGAQKVLNSFLEDKLARYSSERNQPGHPDQSAASNLSFHLHYGHISIQEVVGAVLGEKWTESQINAKTRNKEDFFSRDENVNAFLDEAITWRDVGYQWHFARQRLIKRQGLKSVPDEAVHRPSFNFQSFDFTKSNSNQTLQYVLPEWAWMSLKKHARDKREHQYSVDEFESASTHDELWNAAQLELVHTGRIHNYLRMLWGKKVIQWSPTPDDAYQTLEYLNNKYAIDGRDPNSYTGILWCFGLFDRPWPPERDIFGNVRYMTSESAAKKYKLSNYYQYIRSLAQVAEDRPQSSKSKNPSGRLF